MAKIIHAEQFESAESSTDLCVEARNRRSSLGADSVDVWRIPYHESTLVLDIIDSHTNQMVWRGYDTRTIDFEKSEQTIHKSVEKLVSRFQKDVAKQKEKLR